jgi:hypothetical protein
MSKAGLARVWSILGALLALYATGTWIVLQGGKAFAEIPGLERGAPVASAYQAIVMIGVLLGILCATGIRHMRASDATKETLLPVVAIGDVGPHNISAWSMRLYQCTFFVAFVLVPAAALYKLNDAVLERGVLWRDGDAALGGVALKNAFAWTRGDLPSDVSEHACVGAMAWQGRYWLADMRCDLARNAGLAPFVETGKTIAENAKSSAPGCARDLAVARSTPGVCSSTRDISEACEDSSRRCRGVEWLPTLSPLLMVTSTIFGWAMSFWLIAEWVWKRVRSAGRGDQELKTLL